MATIRSGLAAIAVLLLSGYSAMAQSGNPCAGDIKTQCSGIQPGDSRIKACIKVAPRRAVGGLHGSGVDGGGDRQGLQGRRRKVLRRRRGGHRRHQDLYQIAHGGGERWLPGCDGRNRRRQENPRRISLARASEGNALMRQRQRDGEQGAAAVRRIVDFFDRRSAAAVSPCLAAAMARLRVTASRGSASSAYRSSTPAP